MRWLQPVYTERERSRTCRPATVPPSVHSFPYLASLRGLEGQQHSCGECSAPCARHDHQLLEPLLVPAQRTCECLGLAFC